MCTGWIKIYKWIALIDIGGGEGGPVLNTSTSFNYPRFLLIDGKLDGEDEGSDDDDDEDDDDDGGLQSQVRSRYLKQENF